VGQALIFTPLSDFDFRISDFTSLSRQLISGAITDHTRVTVEFKTGELVFEAKAAKK
jgi:hypothetical protein